MCKSIREKYSIPNEAKVVLYVGNISENKNQRQMIEAFSLMSPQLCERTYVLFCGDTYNDSLGLRKMVAATRYPEHLIFCGSITRGDMMSYYSESDAVVLLSYAEGFGLSLVEGMYYGLPCMMFSDIDAFEDIYDANVAVSLNDRSNSSVAEGLKFLLTREWNDVIIKEYSKKFGFVKMAERYINTYKTILYRAK